LPKFYFNVEGGEPDEFGSFHPCVTHAKCEAVRFAGRLLCDCADTYWDTAALNMTVTDEKGLALFMLSISGFDAPAIRNFPDHRSP
jgi:hypothetical protein